MKYGYARVSTEEQHAGMQLTNWPVRHSLSDPAMEEYLTRNSAPL
jgi:hypothetical protein